ncbi:MAG: 50S ribosomal protein L24 [Candidatus Nanoarchaeia archaeon]
MVKKEWSRHWCKSRKPNKQRKYRANAPLHIVHKLMAAHLSKELRQKYKKRSLPVRKGDKVKIERGKFKHLIGEIEKVSLAKRKVLVRGAEIQKKAGAVKIPVWIEPSNLTIVSLNLDDKARVRVLTHIPQSALKGGKNV